MKRTHPTTLVALGLVGIVVGYLIELAAAAAGAAVFVPSISLPVTLVIVAALVVALALPIHRAVTGKSRRRVDPFRAMRTAVLAKACALAGAVLTGYGGGVLLYLISRSVLPASTSIWAAVAAAGGAVILLVAGLVAEFFCTLPPDDDPEDHAEEAGHAGA